MKRKTIALVLTMAMSVMSSIPVMAAQNSAGYYDSNCYKCGGGATTFTVVDRFTEPVDSRLCIHGYENEADILRAYYERVNYYCADCNVNWEENEFSGMEWHCTHDN